MMKKRILIFSSTAFLFLLINVLSCKKEKQEPATNPVTTTPGSSNLLKNAQTGTPFTTGNINDFTLASGDGSVVLLAANNVTGKIYAIDLDDHDATLATDNNWNGTVNDFMTNIAAQMAINITKLGILNMEVNPVSKSVYVLVSNIDNAATAIFKATKGGTKITKLDLSQVKYAAMTFSTSGHTINDLTFGDNTLYLSFNQPSTLNGEIASTPSPFVNNSTISSRPTSVYKSNWGGGFFTDAPLETMTYGEVDGEKRLMGVTVCAPGFSFKTNVIGDTGVLKVNENFNLNTGNPVKVFCINNGDKSYLIEFHFNGRLTRVGEKYLNGTGTNNANAKYILEEMGTKVVAGLTNEDVQIVKPEGTYVMAAKFSDTQLLMMTNTGAVSILDI